MNNVVLKTFSWIPVVLVIFLLFSSPALAATSVRGLPFDTNETMDDEFSWDATTFGAFCYPVNKHNNFVTKGWGEHLYYEEKAGSNSGPLGSSYPGNNVIDDEELIYKTVPFSSKYELVSKLGLSEDTTPEKLGGMFYYMLPWFGKPYIAVENDATQLAAIVCKQVGNDKKTLKAGESWEFKKGYSLTVHQVDVEGDKVWFSLYRDGEELESAVVNADGTVENHTFTATADFGDADDQLYFLTYVDSVFMGTVDSFATFKYTWLIDKDDVMLIEADDEYQGFEVETADPSGITLSNKDPIKLNLDKDKKTYFTDSWYFQTSDEGKGSSSIQGYVLYPAMDVTIKDDTASGSENSELEKQENENENIEPVSNSENPGSSSSESKSVSSDMESKESAKMEDEASQNPEEENSETKAPGFEILLAVSGIFSVFLLKKK
ncbi:S-layer protein domain-containing protein [Methanosarcina sp. WH1]|uniref:S-layer protein domain-containing protein n=1 Tax=Methanosarcina sp. WH1 TaxID=1434102 RepID=UPI0006160000|nr:S-layer protein domain-containing protein [Methanosarcina sp. WH1]AKB21682.1 hypothetical protein MSWH1_1411 [Methanosarcina sp. WH1]